MLLPSTDFTKKGLEGKSSWQRLVNMNLLEDAVLLDWESQKKCLRHQGKKKEKKKKMFVACAVANVFLCASIPIARFSKAERLE